MNNSYIPAFECRHTLVKHTKPLNTLKLNKDATMLLSGADDGLLLVWNILHGSLEQTISVTFNGPVSAAVWTPISPNRPSTTFAFGCADGTMFAYHQTQEDEPYRTTCLVPAHDGRVETLAFDTHHRRIASAGSGCAKVWQLDMEGHFKLIHTLDSDPYIIRNVSFHERGSNLLICYLESHQVLCMKIENWVKEWCHSLPTRIGHATISGDGGTLIVSNLVDGVDTYAIPPQEPLRSFRHPINSNVPLLVSAVMDSSLIVVGSDDGCPRIYDHHTGQLSMSLPHGKGLVQIVDAISDNGKSILVTGTSDTDDIAIKIWAPIKEIAEDTQKTSPPPVYSTGLYFWQIVCIILVCCGVQAILLNLPFDRISDLIQNCLKLTPHFHH